MLNKKPRLGIDIGGTFTDIVLEKNKKTFFTKILTDYKNPEKGIIQGIKEICFKSNTDQTSIGQILHGTTLATNTLIQRKGAKTAFVTTKGFRDVIEMRNESRFEQYDLNITLPSPLVERKNRFVVNERIDSDGNILKSLNTEEIIKLAKKLKSQKFESISIGLLHSYLNNTHERLILKILKKELKNSFFSISSEVSPQMREYERFNTVICNAYIKPLIKTYLTNLQKNLFQENIRCNIFLIHSAGGLMSINEALAFPVRLVESGPAGGSIFSSYISKIFKLKKVLSFDMGGTTAKICLINNYSPKNSKVFEVARTYRFKKGSGMPISIPAIDMVEIGAGGGSIAKIDQLGQIRVGPESSESDPGPICYNLGGTKPTVTDANLILGKLDPDNFADGKIKLNLQKVKKEFKDYFPNFNLKILESAFLIAETVDENMSNAARVHAIENGEDLTDYTMIAFGGAAPLHAHRICQKLGIKRCIIPDGAGVGSALGFLYAPYSFENSQSQNIKLNNFSYKKASHIFEKLRKSAKNFVLSCDNEANIDFIFKMYMRYIGQGWEIPVKLQKINKLYLNSKKLRNLFELEYQRLYGRKVLNQEIEITSWSVNAVSQTKRSKLKIQKNCLPTKVKNLRSVRVFDQNLYKWINSKKIKRSDIIKKINGPALICEKDTTIVLPTLSSVVLSNENYIDINFKNKSDE